MKRILSLGSAVAVVLALGLTGCDGGGGASEGIPSDVKGYVPLGGPNGEAAISTDPSKVGVKPPKPKASDADTGAAPAAK